MTALPVWLVALALGAVTPWAVRALESVFERRVRRRTLALVAQVLGQGLDREELRPQARPQEGCGRKQRR
jgi:hypothetical protein